MKQTAGREHNSQFDRGNGLAEGQRCSQFDRGNGVAEGQRCAHQGVGENTREPIVRIDCVGKCRPANRDNMLQRRVSNEYPEKGVLVD